MDGLGRVRRGSSGQACGQMLLESLAEAAAHIAAVQPEAAPQKGQFADTLSHHACRRRQNETGPVLILQAGAGQQGVLGAAADIQAEHRTGLAQKMMYGLIHGLSPVPALIPASGHERKPSARK